MRRLILYTKAACPLCDEALDVVREVQETLAFHLEIIDILGDPELYARWKHAIPVGCVDGREVFRYRVTAAELRAALTSG